MELLIILVAAPPNVRILNKPESGKHIVQEGDQLKLECQVKLFLSNFLKMI